MSGGSGSVLAEYPLEPLADLPDRGQRLDREEDSRHEVLVRPGCVFQLVQERLDRRIIPDSTTLVEVRESFLLHRLVHSED